MGKVSLESLSILLPSLIAYIILFFLILIYILSKGHSSPWGFELESLLKIFLITFAKIDWLSGGKISDPQIEPLIIFYFFKRMD